MKAIIQLDHQIKEDTMSRFTATYQGEVIGWYDTADEAQEAIDARRTAEQEDQRKWEQQQREEIGLA